jgi:hypothetical protein
MHRFHTDRALPFESHGRKRICIVAQLRKSATIIETSKTIDEFGERFEKRLVSRGCFKTWTTEG